MVNLVIKMSEKSGLVIKIAWNDKHWRGYDPEAADKVSFKYVKENGLAHEWWAFYEGLDDRYYFGGIPGKLPKEDFEGIIFFISKSIHDGKMYLVGIYGEGEVRKKSIQIIDLRDLLEDMKKTKPEKYEEVIRKGLQKFELYVRGLKEKSFLLDNYIEITPAELGIKRFGFGNIIYLDKEKVCGLLKKIKANVRDENKDIIIELMKKYECNYLPKEIQFEKEIETLLNAKNQVILYGPPGTGKTWVARNYALNGVGENNDRVAFVTFHPSFSYEDFVESIKPNADEDELRFRIEEGIFKRIARNAYNALLEYAGVHVSKRWDANGELPDLEDEERNKVKDVLDKEDFPKFYIIIDEINRGDVSKIFGELITLLEKDKRLFMENEMIVRLPYSKKKFGVPPNLYIIGTMNTADRSIALMDVALRRRFAFLEIMPDMSIVKNLIINNLPENLKDLATKALDALIEVNKRIVEMYDRDHQIGHSYYLQLKDATTEDELESKLKYVWLYEILPLLQEYFYGSENNLAKVLYKCDENEEIEVIECYKNKINSSITGFLDKINESSSK